MTVFKHTKRNITEENVTLGKRKANIYLALNYRPVYELEAWVDTTMFCE